MKPIYSPDECYRTEYQDQLQTKTPTHVTPNRPSLLPTIHDPTHELSASAAGEDAQAEIKLYLAVCWYGRKQVTKIQVPIPGRSDEEDEAGLGEEGANESSSDAEMEGDENPFGDNTPAAEDPSKCDSVHTAQDLEPQTKLQDGSTQIFKRSDDIGVVRRRSAGVGVRVC